jgi:hypothetical protein
VSAVFQPNFSSFHRIFLNFTKFNKFYTKLVLMTGRIFKHWRQLAGGARGNGKKRQKKGDAKWSGPRDASSRQAPVA